MAFYADKMCISPKYLTMLITDNTGRSAKEWIVEYTILEIKVLLKDSNLEIKEVVSRTNFQSNSTMTRFFVSIQALLRQNTVRECLSDIWIICTYTKRQERYERIS